ncbi:dolichyl-diphosphooligosaccharide--protein glycotransferase subunit OST1 SCDLUD_004678 [Saccharomycodes ludwigii]|uniref:dolichyl-diphosphooligosaccharide--protein glycotransferase subunit OST1 n=1 Tax=Saccharomycodes ludwigii TaxID=36035 RepID=UPI001E89AA25|nr:hypothetical protein SCDLUD_004678 [Saccharomycodes ludwigii]KAH3899245.1 hypothetical protein SCDLUD_004678 [Saccharomycodes ludwigii]
MHFVWLFIISIFCSISQSQELAQQKWENLKVIRAFDLSKGHTIERLQLLIKNVGNEPLSEFWVPIDGDVYNKTAFFTAILPDSSAFLESGLSGEHSETVTVDGVAYYYGLVFLPTPIESGETVHISIVHTYNSIAKPFPEYIDMGADQNLKLTTNLYPNSFYPTLEYTLVLAGSNDIKINKLPKEASDPSLISKDETKTTIGPFTSISPLKTSKIDIVYSRNAPILRFSNLKREVWVSQWSSTVQFEEHYDAINDAAKLKDGFVRATWMSKQLAVVPRSHLAAFDVELPADSSAHYYTDAVGMITTWKRFGDRLLLKPRFPLFGGWKSNFTLGWTNDLSQFLHTVDNEEGIYLLSIPILNGPVDSTYDQIDLSVFLPEGSEVLDVTAPVNNPKITIDNKKSYFDLKQGHVKVTVEMKNLNDGLSQGTIFVRYKYNKDSFYMKPLSIGMNVFIALIAFFIMKRIDFSIEK